jgi:hypothetical protein
MNKYLLLPLMLLTQTCLAASPVSIDLSAGILLDDNITNGRDSKDIEKDTVLNVDATATYNMPAGNSGSLAIFARLAFEQYQDFDKLNNSDLALGVNYQLQGGRMFTSPWYFVSAELGSREYDSDLRDGSYQELGIGLGKRLTDRMTLIAGYSRFSMDADNNISDVDYNRIYLNTDLKLNRSNTFYATLSLYSGDIISTNVPPHPAELNNISWVDDDAYPTLSSPWTYRLDADTLALQIGDNYAIAHNQAIDVSISYFDSDTDYNFTYDRTRVRVNYLYRF